MEQYQSRNAFLLKYDCKGLSGNALKVIAIIAMTIDHLAWVGIETYEQAETPLQIGLHCIGRLTAPMMIFFVDEGYHHTHNFRRYLNRLIMLAVVSHFAFCYFNMSGFNPLDNLLFNATSIAWPLLWGLILLKVWDMKQLARWQQIAVTLLACMLTFTSDWSCAAPLAILMIGRSRGNFCKQMLWMMVIITGYAVAFFVTHSQTYGMVHMACWMAVPLLALYNGQRGRCRWLGKFFYYYYPATWLSSACWPECKTNYKTMKRLVLKLMLLMVGVVTVSANRYDVRDYGAKGDGRTLDHGAINAAIEACVAGGGGQVVVPAGTYLCGSIRLKSLVELHLMAGATILAAPASMKAYDESESFGGFPEYQDGGHTYFHNSLIWAEGQHDVSITGRGMIDGEGLTRKDTERAGNVQGGSIGTGDKAIALKLCRNVTIRDITIYRGGHFAIIVTGCKIGTIDNVTIDTNRDGIDIDCCKYFTVSNTKVNTPHDDAIVLKSSYALKRPVLCEHILITNCIVTGYKLGTFLDGTYVPEQVNWVCGRIKLGTESNGGYRNITISNCTCMWSSGLAFEVVDQGRMENIVVSNISMSHVHHYPIYITTGCRNRGPKERTDVSTARDISISQVIADDCDSLAGIIVTGMAGEPIRNVSLSNIRIQYRGGGKKVTTPYREQSTNYPEPRWAGPTPAYGLFARHVDGLRLDHVEFELLRPDERPDIVLEDVKRASAWAQETVDRSLTRHNFLYAGEGKQRRMFIVKDGQVAWRYDNPQGRGEISDAVLMTDGNVLVAHQYGICEVTHDNKTTWKYDAPQGTEIHTIQPIGRDRVLFVQNGHPAKVVVMSIPSCQIAYEFEVPASEGVHGQFRNARLSSRGTLLLANMGLDYVAEYNAEGHELTRWECPAPWSVAELANDRLLFVGRGLVREIDRGSGLGSVVRELKTADYGIKSPQKAVRLENGNTIINDWHNEWRTPIDTLNAPVQAIEIDRAGNVVWQLCAWTNPDLGPSTTIQPLDQAVDRDRLFFGRRNGF